MKRRIIQVDKTLKVCECGNDIFRCSNGRSRVTHKEPLKTSGFKVYGVIYDLRICDKCNKREEFNHIEYHTIKRSD